MVIYADVLLAVNLYINYFLIRAAALLLRRKITPLRSLLASCVGACGALVVLLPSFHPAVTVLIKTALGLLITLVAFGKQKRVDFLISALCFLAVSFGFGGAMSAVWSIASPDGMYVRNGTAYFDIPIIAAALITAAAYGAFRLLKLIIDRRRPRRHEPVTVRCNGVEICLDGLADTGNSLRDCFSGKPVVIASLDKAASIIPENVLTYLSGTDGDISGLRLVPCRTVTSDGVVPVFPAEISIGGRRADALLGITPHTLSGADCIFDPNIIT